MTSQAPLDPRIAEYLADGPTDFAFEHRRAIALASEEIAQRRVPFRLPALGAGRAVRFGLVGLVAVIITGSLAVLQPRIPGAGSQVGDRVVWTDAYLQLPFPGALRSEPLFGAGNATPTLVSGSEDFREGFWSWSDPEGDDAETSEPRADLVTVEYSDCRLAGRLCVFFRPAQTIDPPGPSSFTEWIAYGLAVDRDGDGRVDARMGLDNVPNGSHRTWWMDLETGATESVISSAPGESVPEPGGSEFPWSQDTLRSLRGSIWLGASMEPERQAQIWHPGARFYMWSALVRDERIVSADFAPDQGWLTLPAMASETGG